MTTSHETTSESDKCQKERERRRKRYKFALVKYHDRDGEALSVEHKDVLRTWWWAESHTVICDDQPERVLKGMLKLLKEP